MHFNPFTAILERGQRIVFCTIPTPYTQKRIAVYLQMGSLALSLYQRMSAGLSPGRVQEGVQLQGTATTAPTTPTTSCFTTGTNNTIIIIFIIITRPSLLMIVIVSTINLEINTLFYHSIVYYIMTLRILNYLSSILAYSVRDYPFPSPNPSVLTYKAVS